MIIALLTIVVSQPVGPDPSYTRQCSEGRRGASVYWDDTDDSMPGELRFCRATPALVYEWAPYVFVASGTTPPPGECDSAADVSRLFFDTDADTNGSLFVCLGAAGWKDIDDDGGAGGGGNGAAVTVDFGAAGNDTATVIVTGQAWVSGTSIIVCAPTLLATADRVDGEEDALLEGLTVVVSERVAGTGFTVSAQPAHGKAIGKFLIHCLGV